MKKQTMLLAAALCALALAGCGGTSTGNKKLDNAVYTNDYVSLAPYTGLSAEKKKYEVTDEAVKEKINDDLSDYAEYESVDRPSQDGDTVCADYSVYDNGSLLEESIDENYSFVIGQEDFGSEFDGKLTGVSKGDHLEFTISYDEDFMYSDWAGKTLNFTVDVKDVQIEILPECTDEFVQKNLGYDSYDAYADAARESLAEQYEQESSDELKENLLQQVIDSSSVLSYTDEAYKEAQAIVENDYMAYADMFGQTLDELYDTLEITEDDLEEEIRAQLYRTLVVDAILENENISLTDAEYEDGVALYTEMYEYDSTDDFLADYSKEDITERLLEDKVLNLLVENADITETPAVYEDGE